MKSRWQGRAWAQREAGGGDDAYVAHQRQPVLLGHGHDDELHLGGGEGAADAVARASAEWEVSQGRARGRPGGREVIAVEDLGSIPDSWMAVGEVGGQQDDRAG